MLRIKTNDPTYASVKIATGGTNRTVNLSLAALKEYQVLLKAEQARRIAYALLLAADGIDPKNP